MQVWLYTDVDAESKYLADTSPLLRGETLNQT